MPVLIVLNWVNPTIAILLRSMKCYYAKIYMDLLKYRLIILEFKPKIEERALIEGHW